MYIVKKQLEVAGAHNLKTTYATPCNRIHGHNWAITVTLASDKLDENGMVFDFKHIKERICDVLDHQYINEIIPDVNPTAENMAKWICDQFDGKCICVDVEESSNNVATYINTKHKLYGKIAF